MRDIGVLLNLGSVGEEAGTILLGVLLEVGLGLERGRQLVLVEGVDEVACLVLGERRVLEEGAAFIAVLRGVEEFGSARVIFLGRDGSLSPALV